MRLLRGDQLRAANVAEGSAFLGRWAASFGRSSTAALLRLPLQAWLALKAGLPNYAGQGVELIRDIQPAATIVGQLVAEAEYTIRSLTTLLD